MVGLVEQNSKDRVFTVMLVLLYLVMMMVQYFVPEMMENSSLEVYFSSEMLKINAMSVFTTVVCIIQMLLCIELTLSCRLDGYIAQIVLNTFNILFTLYSALTNRFYFSIAGILVCIVTILVCSIINTQRQQSEKNLKLLQVNVFTDELTGLPNRKERISKIDGLISGEKRKTSFALVLMDLDDFKLINDSLTHQIGDVYLLEILHNIEKVLTPTETIGRFGGDEFLFILEDTLSDYEIEEFIQKIRDVIVLPFCYKSIDYTCTASFGITRYPKDSITTLELMRQMELALYRAKAHGKDQYMFFDEEMQINLDRKIDMEHKLLEAINNNELYVEYQPQFKIPERRLRGYEALARWNSPALGQVSPGQFIPVAEENGFIVAIGEFVLRRACEEYMKVYSSYEVHPILSVNISVVQIRDPDFVNNVKMIINETGIDVDYLEFEITESIFMSSSDMAKNVLKELKALGINLALDDFGTRYSSLNYLRTLPLDIVKIDKSFIDPIGIIPEKKNLVKTIIDMAHQLDLKVVAEGIETAEQLDYLANNGCDYIQGNYLGKPAQITALL